MTAPGMRMQFKSALGKHLNPDYTVDKNVSYLGTTQWKEKLQSSSSTSI